MYKSNSRTLFQLEHCCNILRNEAKWLNLRDNVKVHPRQPATQFCPTFAGSTNLEKKEKKLKKRKISNDVVPRLSSQLDEIK